MDTCCTTGHIHDGSPRGHFEHVHGVSTYVSRPANGSKSRTAIILTDVFGPASINVQLHADKWAERGYHVVVPDIFQGEPFEVGYLCEEVLIVAVCRRCYSRRTDVRDGPEEGSRRWIARESQVGFGDG